MKSWRRATPFVVIAVLSTFAFAPGAQAHTAPPHLKVATGPLAQGLPDPPAGQVTLRLDWVFHPRPLPGVIRAFEPAGRARQLWAMESLKRGQPVPVGKEFKGSVVFVTPGKRTLVTLVWRNPTNRDIRFYVVPHQVIPTSGASSVWLTCLCMSLLYGAPAGGAWYRTIDVGVAPDVKPGTKFVAVHTVITDPAMFPSE